MNSINNIEDKNQILYANFNQDFSCISIGTNVGYLIYNVQPLKKYIPKVILNIIKIFFFINIELCGGIGIIEMLYKTNILALVGGGIYPKFSINKITIWDNHQDKIISQIRFNSEVIKVKIRKDVIIGALQDRIYIINIITLETIDILETYNNPQGIFSISYTSNELLIAFPYAKTKGKVQLENFFLTLEESQKNEQKIINAHESQIAYISMNNEGTILATASDKGTLIRIFLISRSDHPISVLRRGKKNVKMNCLVFDLNNEIIGCTSDVGTTHVFNITEINKFINDKKHEEQKVEKKEEIMNKKEKLKISKNTAIKLAVNERSFGKFKIQEAQSILGFYQDNRMMLITSKGTYYKVQYDTKEGCKKLEEGNIDINN